MIHQPMTCRFSAPPSTLASEAEEMLDLRNTIANIYAKTTRKPLSVVQQDLERDTFMSAKEAQAYGIIDHISKPPAKRTSNFIFMGSNWKVEFEFSWIDVMEYGIAYSITIVVHNPLEQVQIDLNRTLFYSKIKICYANY